MRHYTISVPFGGQRREQEALSSRAPLLGQWLRGSTWNPAKMVSILLLGVLAYALYAFSYDYAFFVYEASIQGNRLIPAETIYAVSGVDGYSIFWLQPQTVAEAVSSGHPYVKKVRVHCQWPNQVIIEVTERLPQLVWQVGAEELWVDDEGVALTPLEGPSPPLLLLIDDEGRAADSNEPQRLRVALVEGIQLVADRMPEITQFRYDRKWGLFFQSSHGWQVALGYGEELPYKVEVLLRLEEELLATGQHPQLIDLRFSGGMRYR